MNRIRTLACVGAAAAVGFSVGVVAMSQPEAALDLSKMSKKELAAMLEKASAPGEEHRVLEALVGEADVESRVALAPDAPPIITHGKGKGEWILGKRCVLSRCEPAPGEELKTEALNVFGYDTRTKKYFWWGVDSVAPHGTLAEGDYDMETRTFTLFGKDIQPGVPFKMIAKLEDGGRTTTELWYMVAGAPGADKDGWLLVGEVVSTKRK